MGYIDPKRDYKDGDILYGIDLNASNATIKAGVDDNFDRIQGLETSKQDNLTAGEGIEITEDNVINNTQTSAEWGNIQGNIEDQTDLINLLGEKQDTLVSGTNIKTINNQDILGEGNIYIGGGSGGTSDYDQLENRPQINNVTLSGNKSLSDLGINIPTKLSDLTNDNNTVTDANYVHTDNNYTIAEKNKLAGVDDIIVVGDETSATSQTEIVFEETDLDAQYTEAEYYSKEEVKTNKVWIDGKPIYRKVVEYTITDNSGNFPHFSTGIGSIEHAFVFIEKQYGTEGSREYISTITCYNGYVRKSDGEFYFNRSNSDATKADLGDYKIIIEYTKAS